MSLLRRPPVLLVLVLAASGAVAAPASGASPVAAAPGASLGVQLVLADPEGARQEVGVMAEPALGRVEVHTWFWSTASEGRYLHIGLGSGSAASCEVTRWVVLDKSVPGGAPAAFDADWEPIAVEEFEVGEDLAEDVTRIAIDELPPSDCVRSASYDGPDPADPGPKVLRTAPKALAPLGFPEDTTWPADLTCPDEIEWNQTFEVTVGLRGEPGPLPDQIWPSHVGSYSYDFPESDDYTVVSEPELPTNVDLWTAEPSTATYVLQADPEAVHEIDLGTIGYVRDGVRAERGCEVNATPIPVSMPVPTGWTGTLAGETWWWRGTDWNSGIGEYDIHPTVEFLDDEWVYLSGGAYQAPRTEPCVAVEEDLGQGCHRYYFDEATGRLQVDDRLLRPTESGGWLAPGSYSAAPPVMRPDRTIAPVTTGKRFRYEGTSRGDRTLVLRLDGSYRYTFRDLGERRTWTGRYRFVGGDAQELVLRRPGPDVRHEVLLFFGVRQGERRLFDIETEDRRVRFSRW